MAKGAATWNGGLRWAIGIVVVLCIAASGTVFTITTSANEREHNRYEGSLQDHDSRLRVLEDFAARADTKLDAILDAITKE